MNFQGKKKQPANQSMNYQFNNNNIIFYALIFLVWVVG